jgi:hypothetical protein
MPPSTLLFLFNLIYQVFAHALLSTPPDPTQEFIAYQYHMPLNTQFILTLFIEKERERKKIVMELGDVGKGEFDKGGNVSPLSLQQENAVLQDRIKELEAKNSSLMKQCEFYKNALDDSKIFHCAQECLREMVSSLAD